MAPTLRRRLASLLYEALVVIAIVLVVVALYSLGSLALPGSGAHRPFLLGLCFAVLAAYFSYCWRNGQTLAMRAWKIRVVDAQGAQLHWGRAFLRYVLAWVWVVPPLATVSALHPEATSFSRALGVDAAVVLVWIVLWSLASLLRNDRQFWHDAVAGTRLIDA